jgi:hypothetical protein
MYTFKFLIPTCLIIISSILINKICLYFRHKDSCEILNILYLLSLIFGALLVGIEKLKLNYISKQILYLLSFGLLVSQFSLPNLLNPQLLMLFVGIAYFYNPKYKLNYG